MDTQRVVAWNLRKWRVKRGLSQEQLAVDAGVNRTYVSSIERALENPTVELLQRFARALGVPVAELVAVPPPKERPPKPLSSGRKKKVHRIKRR